MNLNNLLREKEASIVDEATRSLERSVLPHYQQAGLEVGRKRLMELYRLVRAGIADRDLAPVVDYMAQVADERYHAGYAIREVQIAINVLEEAMWDYIVQDTPPNELAEALGLVSTALGAAKDSLARTYVSLASQIKAPSLDLSALFEGYTGG
ncbi:MAG: hypothetical protein KBF17_04890 [Candidatus Promineofilum sp.]|mgnify:CR=1|nr:hypothetical protein [Promineifilum sp.]MBP9656229.1 hypothetical protein [Promineifilum sp.]